MKTLVLGVVTLAIVVATSLPLVAKIQDVGPSTDPKLNASKKIAIDLCIAAMAAGAYEATQPQDLAQYCIDVALRLETRDYSVGP